MCTPTLSGRLRRRSHFLACLLLAGSVSTSWAQSGEATTVDPDWPTGIPFGETLPDALPHEAVAPRTLYTVGAQGNCDFDDLQEAINAASHGDTIRVARSNAHLGRTYQIWGKGLTIVGGVDTCNLSEQPSGRTVLDANNASQRVFDIWQTFNPPATMPVRLENLSIRRGNGGVFADGQLGRLSVALVNTEVRNNNATANGGGVRVRTVGLEPHTGSEPLLTVDNDSSITNNTSQGNGGGLSCDDQMTLAYTQTTVRVGSGLIAGNGAIHGGGVANNGCRNMFLYTGSPIILLFPSGGLYLNTAENDGGALHVSNGGTVQVRGDEFSGFGDPNHAAMVVSNDALNGGGIAVTGENSSVLVLSGIIRSNTATMDGGGVLVSDGGQFLMRPIVSTVPCRDAISGSGVLRQPPCSLLSENTAGAVGGALRLLNGAEATIRQTTLAGNTATNSANVGGAFIAVNSNASTPAARSTAVIDSSLVTGNLSNVLAYVGNNGDLDIRWTTIAGNTANVSTARVYSPAGVSSRIRFLSSIVYGNSSNSIVAVAGPGNGIARADCVIGPQTSAQSELTSTYAYGFVDPLFVDPDGGDFRLQPISPAIDFCDATNPPLSSHDLDGNARGVSWDGPPHEPNPGVGPYDLGAYEAQHDDVIFANGFE